MALHRLLRQPSAAFGFVGGFRTVYAEVGRFPPRPPAPAADSLPAAEQGRAGRRRGRSRARWALAAAKPWGRFALRATTYFAVLSAVDLLVAYPFLPGRTGRVDMAPVLAVLAAFLAAPRTGAAVGRLPGSVVNRHR